MKMKALSFLLALLFPQLCHGRRGGRASRRCMMRLSTVYAIGRQESTLANTSWPWKNKTMATISGPSSCHTLSSSMLTCTEHVAIASCWLHHDDLPPRSIRFKVESQTPCNHTLTSNHPTPTLFEQALMDAGIEYKRMWIATPRHYGKWERQHREDERQFYKKLRM